MNIFQSPFWSTILQILRDPIFGLIFSIILTILAARAVRKVIKVIFYLGALAAFVWLVTHNKSFADVCIAIVSAVFNILLVLIGVLAAITVIAIISVLIMFVIEQPSSHRRRPPRYRSPVSWDDVSLSETSLPTSKEAEIRKNLAAGYVTTEQATLLLTEKLRRIELLMQDLVPIFNSLGDEITENHWFKALIDTAHLYFSGLSPHMVHIRKIHKACNSKIADLVSILPAILVDPDVQTLKDIAQAKTFLPDKDEWQNLKDRYDAPPIPYVLLRLLCLHRDWKELGTTLYKSYCYVKQLKESIEALEV
jgi:hypothetical protein